REGGGRLGSTPSGKSMACAPPVNRSQDNCLNLKSQGRQSRRRPAGLARSGPASSSARLSEPSEDCMPTAKELLDRAELDAAIAAQTQDVKANPGEPARRTFLFELLCFTGDWDRAEKQVDVLASASVEAGMAVQVYKSNIAAERQRDRLFAEGVAPHFLNEPPAYVDLQVEGIRRLATGDAAGARELFDRAAAE